MLLIAAGYEDADDCDTLHADPVFKMAVGRLPESGNALATGERVPYTDGRRNFSSFLRAGDSPFARESYTARRSSFLRLIGRRLQNLLPRSFFTRAQRSDGRIAPSARNRDNVAAWKGRDNQVREAATVPADPIGPDPKHPCGGHPLLRRG